MCHRIEQPRYIERRPRQSYNGAAPVEDRRGEHKAGAVHQRCGGQTDRWCRAAQSPADMVEVRNLGIAGRVGCQKQVMLAPHHPARQAGGATGVNQYLVVAAATPCRDEPSCRRLRRCFIRNSPARACGLAVVNKQPSFYGGAARTHRFGLRSKCTVKDHRGGISVGPKLDQFIAGVAIIGVDRHQTDFQRREHAFHIGGGIVKVECHLVLAVQPSVQQHRCNSVCAGIEVVPGDALVAVGQRNPVGNCGGDSLPDVGEGPVRR